MPKLKTSRGAAKRFKVSSSGKIKHKRAYLRHILSTKSPKQKRRLRKASYVDKTDAKRIRRLIPYS